MLHVFNPAKGNKWLYLEMIRDQRTEGDLDIGRNGMEYVLGVLAHLNNATGKTFVADSTIAKQAGYAGNNHKFGAVREVMQDAGYLHVWGKKGRAFEVSLLVPARLHEQYEELSMSTRKVQTHPGASPMGELTHNSVPGTQIPGLQTRDSKSQDSVTHDPEGRERGGDETYSHPAEGRENRPSMSIASPASSALRSEPSGSGKTAIPASPRVPRNLVCCGTITHGPSCPHRDTPPW
ncbi:hypothetical protein [Streptomyces albofaciens]|uniref:hypothetical protein n=1 Tax=Streptomyces albofaciens TaxID=66866 RepID=UPI000A9D31E5|nr:hypothetical protein [Streptomyces albofaciens]